MKPAQRCATLLQCKQSKRRNRTEISLTGDEAEWCLHIWENKYSRLDFSIVFHACSHNSAGYIWPLWKPEDFRPKFPVGLKNTQEVVLSGNRPGKQCLRQHPTKGDRCWCNWQSPLVATGILSLLHWRQRSKVLWCCNGATMSAEAGGGLGRMDKQNFKWTL